MDREKQIEEMEIALREASHELDKAWHECLYNNGTQPRREFLFTAQYLVENKGYCKTTDLEKELEDWKAIAEQYQRQFEEARADVAREIAKRLKARAGIRKISTHHYEVVVKIDAIDQTVQEILEEIK